MYGIIEYFIRTNINLKALNAVLSSISIVSMTNDLLTHDLLEFILVLLLSPLSNINGKMIELLVEPNVIEGLYALLVMNNLSNETKEIVLKILKVFIDSKKVSQKVCAQLRLEKYHIGFGGIISRMALNALSQSFVQEILNLIITSSNIKRFNLHYYTVIFLFVSDSLIAIHHLNIVLTFFSAASLEIRCLVIHKVRKPKFKWLKLFSIEEF